MKPHRLHEAALPNASVLSELMLSVMGRPLNGVEGYQHGFHAREYLAQCAHAVGLRAQNPEHNQTGRKAMLAAGHTAWSEFCRDLGAWHDLQRPMPRRYAECIGATEERLLDCIELDREAFRLALTKPLHLRTWTSKRLANVYELRRFPNGTQSEIDCLAHVMESVVESGKCACINIPGLKTMWIEPPSGSIYTVLREPVVKFTATEIVFSDDGRNEKAVHLGAHSVLQ